MSLIARARTLLRLKETGNLAWLLGEYGVRFVIEFLIGALIARRLGPTGFAPYALLFTLITLVIPFTDAGLNHLISRAVLTKEQTLDRILGTAAALRFLTCLIGIPVLAALAHFSSHGSSVLVGFAVAAGVLNTLSCFAVLDYYFQSQLEAKRSAIARTSAIAVIAVVQGTLLLSGATGTVFLWGLCLEQPLFGIAYYVVHRVTGGLPVSRWHLDLTYGISLFSRSIRLNVAAMFSAVSFRIPAILLARFAVAAATVGLWGAASEPVELWFVLSNALAATLFPRLVGARTGGPRRFQQFLKAGFGGITLCGLAIAAVLAIGAPVIIGTIYGSAYDDAVSAMQIYALALPFIFFRAFMSKWLVLQEHYWLSVGSQGLGAAVAVALGYLLIHSHPSATSAALTTLCATVASSIVALALSGPGRQLLWSLVRRTPLDPFSDPRPVTAREG